MANTTAEFKIGTAYRARVTCAPGTRTSVVYTNALTGTPVSADRVAEFVKVPVKALDAHLRDRVAASREASRVAAKKAEAAVFFRAIASLTNFAV